MQIPYIKMETNGYSVIILQDQSINKRICLKQLAENMCHISYGIGANGILIVDEKYRPIPFIKAYNKNGERVPVSDDSLRIVANYLLNQTYNCNQLEINIGDKVIPISSDKIGSSIKYMLPESHTEESICFDDSKIITYRTESSHSFIFRTNGSPSYKKKIYSCIEDHSENKCCFINQKTPSSLYVDCMSSDGKRSNPTDYELCQVLTVLRNKNMLDLDPIIQIDVPSGQLKGICDYDSVLLTSKVHEISHGTYFY